MYMFISRFDTEFIVIFYWKIFLCFLFYKKYLIAIENNIAKIAGKQFHEFYTVRNRENKRIICFLVSQIKESQENEKKKIKLD